MQDYYNEKELLDNNSNQNFRLGKSQKIMAGLLAFFALFVIVMWTIQFKRNLSAPFAYKGGWEEEIDENKRLEALKTKDTDGDGLSDYDELYAHKTSPYLEDSDSDGILDGAEIAQGADPNCPLGQNCFASEGEANASQPNENQESESFDILNPSANKKTPTLSTEEEKALKELFGSDIDAPTLRQLLLERGMDKAMLDKISDEELMKSFAEVLAE